MNYNNFIKAGKKQGRAEAYAELCRKALKTKDNKISFEDIMQEWDKLNETWEKYYD